MSILDRFKHKETLGKDAPEGSIYIPDNPRWFKIEIVKASQFGGPGQIIGLHLYLDLNCPFSIRRPRDDSPYKIRVRKEQKTNDVVPHYYLDASSTDIIKQIIGENVLLDLFRGEKNKHSNITITREDIKRENTENDESEKERKHNYTILHIEPIPPKEGEQQADVMNAFSQNDQLIPNDELLLELTNFSEMYDSIYGQKIKAIDTDGMSKKQILAKIDEILSNYHIEEDDGDPDSIRNKLKSGLNLTQFANQDKKDMKSGVILYGPPGTGKTYMVMNPIKEICENILGFEFIIENMAEKLGGDDSQYINAGLRAVNSITAHAMKRIQATQKPVILFIDEGDKLMKGSGHESSQEGIAAMKNILNPSNYPGLIMILNTNLEWEDLDRGIAKRRLADIHIGYPSFERARKIWEVKKSAIFGDNPGNLTEEQLDALAGIIADNAGLDAIDTFISEYKSAMGGYVEKIDDFNTFRIGFFKTTLKVVDQAANEKLRDIRNSNTAQVRTDELEKIEKAYQAQKVRLMDAFRGTDSRQETVEKTSKLALDGDQNYFYKTYMSFIELLPTFFNLLQKILTQEQNTTYSEDESKMLVNMFNFVKDINQFLRRAPMQHQQLLMQYENHFKALQSHIEFALRESHGENDIVSKIPELIVAEKHSHSVGDIAADVAFLLQQLPKELPLENNQEKGDQGDKSGNRIWTPGKER